MQSELTTAELHATRVSIPGAQAIRTTAILLSLGLIFVVPMEGAMFIEGVGRLSRVVGLAAGAAWALSVIVSGRLRKPRAFHYWMGLFILWNALSILWTVDTALTVERIKTFAQLGVMVLILWDLYDSPQAIRAGLQSYVFGAFAASLGIFQNYLRSDAFYAHRFTAAGLHVDDIGIVLALSIPVAWYLAISHKPAGMLGGILRIANFLIPAFALLGICLSGTRTALIAAAPALLFMLASLIRFRPAARIGITVAMACAATVVLAAAPEKSLERLGTIQEEITHGDLNGRIPIWRDGLFKFSERSILGTGAYAYRIATGTGTAAHNSLLSVMVELGMIGLAIFLICIVFAVRDAIRLPKWEAGFCLTWLAVWFLGVSALTWEHRKPTWIVLGFVTAMASAHLNGERK